MQALLLPFLIGSLNAPVDSFPTPEIPALVAMCGGQPGFEAQQKCSDEKIMEHLQRNISYPEICKELGIEGTVILQFTVGVDGFAYDVEVLRGVHPAIDAEARRVIDSMPIFLPARINNEFVPSRLTLPIKFTLQ